MNDATPAMRHCPECGMNTRKERCPDDHSPTIMLGGFERDALSFRPDEIVAGRYRITGTLARGGYSAVYAASHHSTRQPIAIKMLSIQHDVDAMRKVVRRFWREAQITARMTSPHTVRIIDVGQVHDGPLFIAMERLRGRTLGSFLKGLFKQDLVMSQDEAIGMAVPVLRCLEEAHDLGLVHRDLKPNNIMLARVGADDNIVKVLDFGVARVKDSSLTADGNTLGTPAYMSPEQFRAAKVDARSDLYSLGVILFLAVCGRLPFREKNIHALGMQHINDPVPDPRQYRKTQLSDGFVDALMCTLRKSPSERYQSARTMRQALELVRGGAATGLSVAHIQLLPAGRALIEQSVSARDSQAFLAADEADDATIGIHEIDATIGIEEMEAAGFAEALNADNEATPGADAPTGESNPVRSDTVEQPLHFDHGSLHAATPAAEAVSPPDAGAQPMSDDPTPAMPESLVSRDTATDSDATLGDQVADALVRLDNGDLPSDGSDLGAPLAVHQTAPMFSATPAAESPMDATTERPSIAGIAAFTDVDGATTIDEVDPLDSGTPSAGVPTL